MEVKTIIIRLVVAVIIGGIIGYDRETHNRAAGFRTHILVCVGAAIIGLTEQKIAWEIVNYSSKLSSNGALIQISMGRLGAQVVSGIGFLGAGTIIYNKGTIKGLTTAASLWVVACMGLVTGYGYLEISILGVLFSLITLRFLGVIQDKFIKKNKE